MASRQLQHHQNGGGRGKASGCSQMWWRLAFLLTLASMLLSSWNVYAAEPCTDAITLNENWRDLIMTNQNKDKCDKDAFEKDKWYKFSIGGIKARIPNLSVKNNMCGTTKSMFINLEGQNYAPDVGKEIIALLCTFDDTNGTHDECYSRSEVKIVTCGNSEYAYQFSAFFDNCPAAVCAIKHDDLVPNLARPEKRSGTTASTVTTASNTTDDRMDAGTTTEADGLTVLNTTSTNASYTSTSADKLSTVPDKSTPDDLSTVPDKSTPPVLSTVPDNSTTGDLSTSGDGISTAGPRVSAAEGSKDMNTTTDPQQYESRSNSSNDTITTDTSVSPQRFNDTSTANSLSTSVENSTEMAININTSLADAGVVGAENNVSVTDAVNSTLIKAADDVENTTAEPSESWNQTTKDYGNGGDTELVQNSTFSFLPETTKRVNESAPETNDSSITTMPTSPSTSSLLPLDETTVAMLNIEFVRFVFKGEYEGDVFKMKVYSLVESFLKNRINPKYGKHWRFDLSSTLQAVHQDNTTTYIDFRVNHTAQEEEEVLNLFKSSEFERFVQRNYNLTLVTVCQPLGQANCQTGNPQAEAVKSVFEANAPVIITVIILCIVCVAVMILGVVCTRYRKSGTYKAAEDVENTIMADHRQYYQDNESPFTDEQIMKDELADNTSLADPEENDKNPKTEENENVWVIPLDDAADLEAGVAKDTVDTRL